VPERSFDGAGVVVTGAGHGIGRAIAARMASAGARVVVNDLDEPSASRRFSNLVGRGLLCEALGGRAVTAKA
jgi:NAD(P)-dependent dehydrogenase (short-subunit alcohol dehydrogenase family)